MIVAMVSVAAVDRHRPVAASHQLGIDGTYGYVFSMSYSAYNSLELLHQPRIQTKEREYPYDHAARHYTRNDHELSGRQ